jgi:hypothetical protein
MKYQIEITDTFGGEANYSWVTRKVLELKEGASDLSLVRQAKKLMGWNGTRCETNYLGETIQLTPSGMCQVMFITESYE